MLLDFFGCTKVNTRDDELHVFVFKGWDKSLYPPGPLHKLARLYIRTTQCRVLQCVTQLITITLSTKLCGLLYDHHCLSHGASPLSNMTHIFAVFDSKLANKYMIYASNESKVMLLPSNNHSNVSSLYF